MQSLDLFHNSNNNNNNNKLNNSEIVLERSYIGEVAFMKISWNICPITGN